jgi:hypothetical protein
MPSPRRTSGLVEHFIAARPSKVGGLIDFAYDVPSSEIRRLSATLALSVINDYKRNRRAVSRRRRLIILGALVTRLAFEIEGIPRDRDQII